jgi:hypothetical protein
VVALGLLLLDLAGARSSGWFGDLGPAGFAVLAGTVIAAVSVTGAVAARRTEEPRIVSAEIGAACGLVAILAGLQDDPGFSTAAWFTTCLAISALVALAGWRLRLGITTWAAAALGALAWVGLAGDGLVRAVLNPSWSGLVDGLLVWPLVVAAAVAAAPGAWRRLPLAARVGGPAVAVALLTGLVVAPALDEGPQVAALVLAAVAGAAAAPTWLLRRPWSAVTLAPLVAAGGGSAVAAVLAALQALGTSTLLDHGLWTDDAAGSVAAAGIDGSWWALMPLTALAGAVAVLSLARTAGLPHRGLVAPAGAVVLAVSALSPVLLGVPRYAAVASLVLAAGALVTWALARTEPVAGMLGGGLALLALGGAFADDGLTIAVLGLLTTALAAAPLRRTPAWLPEATSWLLPASLGATAWAVASALHVDGDGRAAPVIAVVALLALVRPMAAHEAVGLGTALLAIAVSSGFAGADSRVMAAQLVAVALVATYVGVRRRPEASLIGLVLLGVAALVAWEDALTAAVVLAIAVAATVLHEVRGQEPTALVARAATPVALGGLLWTVTGLSGAATVWQGVPVVLVIGALAVRRPDPVREAPAAVVAGVAALAAVVSLAEPQGWAAVYLTLGGVACTVSSLLHPTRRMAAWIGLALLTTATWLRLEQIGVGTVEAYTLPLAAVLLVVGTVALLRGERSSLQTQGAGLGLALVPSLLQALAEPLALRAALLGIGCVVLIGVGMGKRWAAPLLAGGGTLAVLVLRQVTIAQVLPQWALIAAAGVLLTFLGLTWEQRLADVRTAAGYVRGLR